LIEVVLAGEHSLFRNGLTQILQTDRDVIVSAQVARLGDLVDRARTESADVVILDIAMASRDGFRAMQSISRRAPHVRFLILSGSDDPDSLFDAIRAGAQGFLVKDTDPADFIRAVHQVAAGGTVVSPVVAGHLFEAVRRSGWSQGEHQKRLLQLSDREQEILELLATVESPREIARSLHISLRTVQNHIGSIYRKLGASSRREAVMRSLEIGLVAHRRCS
jgi:DNA-binding NarL/FixJ family response regulator